jgi:hypothetical protein
MKSRYSIAIICFSIGLIFAILLGSILQADSGNTYQYSNNGGATWSEPTTFNWDFTLTTWVIVLFSGIALTYGYFKGSSMEKVLDRTTIQRAICDFAIVILMALVSSALLTQYTPLGGLLYPFQIMLVAVAVAFGSGTGLLAGGAGLTLGIAISSGDSWLLLITAVCGGLEGLLIGRLTGQARPIKLTAAIPLATLLALLPTIFISSIYTLPLDATSLGSFALSLLISTVLGLFIGLMARGAWHKKSMS